MGEGVVAFDDVVRGHVEFDVANLGGDFVIVRTDGSPLYHFTVVVDDAAMGITDVIRGEDHLSNTPKHILLFRALGHELPRFAHLPLILNPDRSKMSKRKSQTAIDDYIAQGFVREALVNYLALLGWATGTEEEVLSLEEIVERFDLGAVHKGGAVFDRERLEWLNGQWIRRLSADDLVDRLRPFVAADLAAGRIDWMPADDELVALLPIIQERLPTLGAIGDLAGFLWVEEVALDTSMLVPKRWDPATTRDGLAAARETIADVGEVVVRGRRARAAAARPRRGPWLEGRRPVHGDPRGGHRPDGHAAALRHARRPRAGTRARAPRSGDRGHVGGADGLTAAVMRTSVVMYRRHDGGPRPSTVEEHVTHDDVQRWLDAYLEAWRTYDPAAIGDLFGAEVSYRYQPYHDPLVGRAAVVADWLESPDDPGTWAAEFEPYAVDGDRAVAVGTSRYLDADGGQRTIYYNVWLLRFDADGRCADFIEYWREPPQGAGEAG